jgi:glycosyltransferase involved in cell wall biosynthesis
MLNSLAQQLAQPAEMVVVDASQNRQTEKLFASARPGLRTKCIYRRAQAIGAAVQRNEAVSHTSYENVLFLDDDIVFEPDCISKLWAALRSDTSIGGVNATIMNQQYLSPGKVSEILFRILNGRSEASYAGRCIGPALNLLPEDRPDLPETVAVEWLNSTCTLYRKAAMPNPPFSDHFVGYSFMEDVALSLTVAEKWKLANARTARIYHDSQPGKYKDNERLMARMELVNRHYIMSRILARTHVLDYMKLALLELFGITTSLTSTRAWRGLPSVLIGKASGVAAIIRSAGESTSKSSAPTKKSKRLATE